MKKVLSFIIALLLTLPSAIAFADGLFGNFDEVFVELPSLTHVTGAEPDEETTDAAGNMVLTYRDITVKQFNAFSDYLAKWGCTLADSSSDKDIFTATVAYKGEQFIFQYSKDDKTAVLMYPDGADVENPEAKFREAESLYSAGQYEKAYLLYSSLGGYRNTDAWLKSDAHMIAAYAGYATYYDCFNPGNVVTFGSFEQDNNPSNGAEPVEWYALERRGSTVKLLSKYILQVIPFDEEREVVTWENSTLRTWLNEDFLNTTFTEAEQDCILTTHVSADPWIEEYPRNQWNVRDDIDQGADTFDKIFVLSLTEIGNPFTGKYFWTVIEGSKSTAEVTPYAVAQGVNRLLEDGNVPPDWVMHSLKNYKGTGNWWTRTVVKNPMDPQNREGIRQWTYNGGDGSGAANRYLEGDLGNNHFIGVRPCLWLDISPDNEFWFSDP